MNYKTWEFRVVSTFKEEVLDEPTDSFESIDDYKNVSLYTEEERNKINAYLKQSVSLIASTLLRKNAYNGKYILDLVFYTDGECIFSNLVFEYMKYKDFVLPMKWYEIIKAKNYQQKPFTVNRHFITTGEIDVFQTCFQTFDEEPIIKQIISYT